MQGIEYILYQFGDKAVMFVDVCCGGGSVSVEFINNGLHPENIYMFDSGAIGAFWQQVSEGTFDLDYFEYIIHKIPSDLENIKGFMEDLSKIEYGYVGDVVQFAEDADLRELGDACQEDKAQFCFAVFQRTEEVAHDIA
jgi:hypothetical protein